MKVPKRQCSIAKQKIIRDAVHGDIELSDEEIAVLDTPAVQRLRGIKQLGAGNLVYPSAVHTRFEHSLGTCAMAKKIVAAIISRHSKDSVFDERIKLVTTVASLLHDITHLPYGHTLEDERRVFDRHDESTDRITHFLESGSVAKLLDKLGMRREVAAAMTGEDDGRLPPIVREVISGTVCADLLDYLKRDAYFCGLAQRYDERIFSYFDEERGAGALESRLVYNLAKDGLFRHDALSELINLLRLRYSLTERVYYHHAKVVAGAMISKAVELAIRDFGLRERDLYELRDDTLLALLEEKAKGRGPIARIIERLKPRQLYRRVFFLSLGGMSGQGLDSETQSQLEKAYHYNHERARETAENLIARELSVPDGAVIIYCPSVSMALKEAEVMVRLENGECLPLKDLDNPEVNVLLQKHRQIWRFYVLLDRAYAEKAQQASEVCEDIIGQTNMLPQ